MYILLVPLLFLKRILFLLTISGKHLTLVTGDPEGGDQYAFDNPCFLPEDPVQKKKKG